MNVKVSAKTNVYARNDNVSDYHFEVSTHTCY